MLSNAKYCKIMYVDAKLQRNTNSRQRSLQQLLLFLIQITRKRQGIFFLSHSCNFVSLSESSLLFCINLVDLILCVFSFYDTRGHYLFSYKQRVIISHADSPGAGVFTDPCCNLNICYIFHIIIPEKNIFEKKFLLCDDKKKS